jgi:hypothetical protein
LEPQSLSTLLRSTTMRSENSMRTCDDAASAVGDAGVIPQSLRGPALAANCLPL